MNLNQVTVPSKNVKSAVEFYRRLGLKQIVENFPSYARFECPNGEATFSIHLVENPLQGAGVVVYFECDDLDKVVGKLKKEGIQFDSDPIDQPWLWREAYLHDPDGNVICLYFAGINRLNPPWKIAINEIET